MTVYKNNVQQRQKEHEREHRTLTWLARERQSSCRNLYCAVCKRNICSRNNFSNSWIKGFTNLKLSNMVDHALSDVHKTAMSRLRANSAREKGESAILSTPGYSDEVCYDRVKLQFDVTSWLTCLVRT